MTWPALIFMCALRGGVLPLLALAYFGIGAADASAFPILPAGPPSCLNTFGSTGSVVACEVPQGITRLHIVATGGWGGGNGGGQPGVVQTDVLTSSGTVYYVHVGGDGGTPAGGFNGGGPGGNLAGGGGGASDVRQGADTLDNRVIVAAGGGGAGQPLNESPGGAGAVPGSTRTARRAAPWARRWRVEGPPGRPPAPEGPAVRYLPSSVMRVVRERAVTAASPCRFLSSPPGQVEGEEAAACLAEVVVGATVPRRLAPGRGQAAAPAPARLRVASSDPLEASLRSRASHRSSSPLPSRPLEQRRRPSAARPS